MTSPWPPSSARYTLVEHNALAVLGLLSWCARVERAARAAAGEPPRGDEPLADEAIALALLGVVSLRRTVTRLTSDAEAPGAAPPPGRSPEGLLR